jgi:glycosyltransferase involved in cell wall biosynthesis
MVEVVRVCHIISSFRPLIGGAERATEDLVCELRRLGADVVVLTRHRRVLPRHECIRGIPVHRLGLDLPRPLGPATFILHVLAWLAVYGRAYPLVHVQNIDAPLLSGMLAKILLRKRLAVTIHGEKNIQFKKRSALGRWRVRLMVGLGDRFVALTEPCRRQYLVEGIVPERIWDIPNGIDTERFCPVTIVQKAALRCQIGCDSAGPVVMYAGRLVDLKRIDLLIEAWASLPQAGSAHLLIVGDGPEREKLRALAEAQGLGERVHFVGATHDVLPYYQAADIFVLPSLYEGLSVALLEAMACGLCVVVAGSPGNLAVVQDGVNGLVFPMEQPELLRERLAEVLADTEKREALGRAARQTVEQKYSIQAVAQAHLEMYKGLLER